jgi:hypothetical protein
VKRAQGRLQDFSFSINEGDDMQARLTTKPKHEVLAAIQALDLESVKVRVMDAELGEGWTREYADSIEAAYKTYLTMLVKYPDDAEDILLSEDVDEFWHTHILHTRKYAEDCQTVFGNFLHHDPQPRDRSFETIQKRCALVEKTHRLYQQESGNGRNAEAAYCAASIMSGKAAYCAASITSGKAAYCAASITSGKAAYCAASITSGKAAYCAASVTSGKAAYCAASVTSGKAAYCAASTGQHRVESFEPMVA